MSHPVPLRRRHSQAFVEAGFVTDSDSDDNAAAPCPVKHCAFPPTAYEEVAQPRHAGVAPLRMLMLSNDNEVLGLSPKCVD